MIICTYAFICVPRVYLFVYPPVQQSPTNTQLKQDRALEISRYEDMPIYALHTSTLEVSYDTTGFSRDMMVQGPPPPGNGPIDLQ